MSGDGPLSTTVEPVYSRADLQEIEERREKRRKTSDWQLRADELQKRHAALKAAVSAAQNERVIRYGRKADAYRKAAECREIAMVEEADPSIRDRYGAPRSGARRGRAGDATPLGLTRLLPSILGPGRSFPSPPSKVRSSQPLRSGRDRRSSRFFCGRVLSVQAGSMAALSGARASGPEGEAATPARPFQQDVGVNTTIAPLGVGAGLACADPRRIDHDPPRPGLNRLVESVRGGAPSSGPVRSPRSRSPRRLASTFLLVAGASVSST